MISRPGAAMLQSKLFVSRLREPFPDLYERWWDGDEWIWLNHGRPGGTAVTGDPGADMLGEKLFVTVEDGALWERHWREDLGRWAWEDHGRPENRPIVHGPGAAMMDSKLFVVTDDGSLWERHWREDLDRWAWEDHGRPEDRRIVAAPGAPMMGSKLFVVTSDGHLWERHWREDLDRWAWEDHGRPPNGDAVNAPGAAMMDSKLFVGTDDGRLAERLWNGRAWVWVDHGRPPATYVSTAPGASMSDSKLFVGCDNGHLFERFWNGRAWVWVDHEHPPDTLVTTAPGASMMHSKLFVGCLDGRMYERAWNGDEWVWVNHGTPYHDQSAYILGRPGTDPKITLAVMGDGYAEDELDDYRRTVDNRVLKALRLDQLENHQEAFRVVRIDVVSVENGVSERRYDEQGTVEKKDDVVRRERPRDSRLGYWSTNSWSHLWLETSSFTNARIQKLRERFAPDATNVIVMANTGDQGGVNRGRTAAFTRGEDADTIAHELGHNLFGLNDEYVNGERTFSGTSSAPNTTEEPDDWADLKWGALVDDGTPLPTDPHDLPRGWDRETSVGAFEGAGGWFEKGMFRPVLRCRMNQSNPPWCPVCEAKLESDLAEFE